jgi:cephalosporin hydroxylase
MAALVAYCDDGLTDKNTVHSYIDAYESLFSSKRDTATNILEIGIGPYMPNGGSILMWAGYFAKAKVHAVDIISLGSVHPLLVPHPRIHLHTQNDAYDSRFFTNTFLSKGEKFDIMVDDGPHTIESMVTFIKLYSQLLKDDGILVVEDVQSMDWIPTLREATPEHLKPYIEVFDRRSVKGRYDDILFVINLAKK